MRRRDAPRVLQLLLGAVVLLGDALPAQRLAPSPHAPGSEGIDPRGGLAFLPPDRDHEIPDHAWYANAFADEYGELGAYSPPAWRGSALSRAGIGRSVSARVALASVVRARRAGFAAAAARASRPRRRRRRRRRRPRRSSRSTPTGACCGPRRAWRRAARRGLRARTTPSTRAARSRPRARAARARGRRRRRARMAASEERAAARGAREPDERLKAATGARPPRIDR